MCSVTSIKFILFTFLLHLYPLIINSGSVIDIYSSRDNKNQFQSSNETLNSYLIKSKTRPVRRDIVLNSQSEPHDKNNNTVCIIRKNGHIYDISSLAEKNFWFYSEISHNDSHLLFLISVCHPIANISSCSSKSGVCFAYINSEITELDYNIENKIDFGKVSFVSGGELTNKYPEVLQEGMLKYEYENGGLCNKDNRRIKYKTILHLQCPFPSKEESATPILMSSPKCLFIFVWVTFAACPRAIITTSDPCIIKFSNSEFPLNLHSLHSKTYYIARGISSSYELNICGPIINGSCSDNTAVCDISDPEKPISVATSETVDFDWQEDGSMMFSYKSNGTAANIFLHCDRTALVPIVFFASKSQSSHNFSIYTLNVCTPQSSDCVFEDKNLHVYDLRSLHKEEGNWEILGRKNETSVLYYLNVCGPINQNTKFKCPPGPVGACQASIVSSGSRNIGFITSNPVVNEDGTISLLYTGGDSCHEDSLTSSTRINFFCNTINYPPAFIRVTPSCEHIFEWHTPAACPVNVASSRDCLITDPLFGHNFNLNLLRNTSSDYTVTNGNQSFVINVCGPLVSPCGEKRDNDNATSVCHVEKRESVGNTPADLVFNDGTLTMKFSEGEAPCGEDRWSSQILFLCSHNERGLEGLQYIHGDENSCVHHFIWHTKAACPPHKEVECVVRDGDLTYDLRPLSDPTVNEIFITYRRVRKYVLNVCRSVVHNKESRCAYDAGACVIDITHAKKTLSLGKVSNGPYLEDGLVKIKYEDGDICNGTRRFSTVIEFVCTDEQYLSYPILYAEENCVTLFKWSSFYACPQNYSSVPPDDAVQEGNCTAVNPLTNYVFDMNTLKARKPHELVVRDGVVLLISACGNVSDPRCPSNGNGACLVAKGGKYFGAGKANQALNFLSWSTYIEYEGGAKCSNGFERSTRISFICQEKDLNAGPVLITDDESSCTFFVNWYAKEACERHIRCFAHSLYRTYDLSALVRHWGNYEVQDPTNPSYTYLINVCRPLNPVIGVNCHPGSSSCLVRKNQEPLGLGHPILNPTILSENQVHLMYAHGSVCPDNPGFSLSSRIIFLCNRSAGAGSPRFLKKVDDCQIQFEWETSLVCPPSSAEGECQIAFDAAKTNVDLSPLKKPEPYRIPHNGKTFLLNVCGATSCLDGSAVCTVDGVGYGLSNQAKLRWEHDTLHAGFYGGDLCQESVTGTRYSKILYECDIEAGFGYPVADPLMDDIHCMAAFTWKTNLTCLEALYPTSRPSVLHSNSTSTIPGSSQRNASAAPQADDGDFLADSDVAHHTWVSVMIACLVLVGVVAASVYVVGRSSHGRRLYARAKRTFSRKGYAANTENDTLLQGETAYVYRVDEDERILRV